MNIWTNHPHEVGMTYKEHFLYAFRIGFMLIKIAIMLWIHAIFPFLYTNTASRSLIRVTRDMEQSAKGKSHD